MTVSKKVAAAVASMAILIGVAGGYSANAFFGRDRMAELEQEIDRLRAAQTSTQSEVPSDEEASAAIAKSGRSIRISECKPRQAVAGVTCTGVITTTTGSFAGSTQPGVLSFARIGGKWTQVQ